MLKPNSPSIEFGVLLGHASNDSNLKFLLSKLGPLPHFDADSTLGFLEYKHLGVSLGFEQQKMLLKHVERNESEQYILHAVLFHSEGNEGYSEFKGKLPGEILFSDSRDQVQKKLGAPANSGGGKRKSFGDGIWPMWDAFKLDELFFTVQYFESNHTVNCVIMESDTMRLQRPR